MTLKLNRGDRLVIATHNPGKLKEFDVLLGSTGLDLVSAGQMGVPEPEETGDSFVANARLKASASMTATGLPALADDSGIEIDALDGAPGIYSARWAGEPRDFSAAMARVQRELAEKGAFDDGTAPRANFNCTLCIATPDGRTECFEGKVFGHLEFPPRGDRGFGYDPIFVPDGHDVTFAEMKPELKDTISHRAVAFSLFSKTVLG
ncbi:MAG: RdgB/HAM1 family non-canonical purine NTP pyrophosphatase [Hyphomicrobiales bacterium]|nr:RdgB/HAM1 family non-canonical purine NTP pyrophosphatase [Hyphomicrobiales bacterium]